LFDQWADLVQQPVTRLFGGSPVVFEAQNGGIQLVEAVTTERAADLLGLQEFLAEPALGCPYR